MGCPHLQAISNSLWSYSKLAYNPGQRVLDTAARRAAGMLHQYTSQEIANSLWGAHALFATCEPLHLHECRLLLQGSPWLLFASGVASLGGRMRHTRSGTLSATVRSSHGDEHILAAFATLEHNPGAAMLDAAAAQIARRIEQFSPQVLFTHPACQTPVLLALAGPALPC